MLMKGCKESFAAYLCLLEDMKEYWKTEQSVPFLYSLFTLPWDLETSQRWVRD